MQLLPISLQWQLFELLKVHSSNKLQKTESSREEMKSIREELENRQQSMFGRKPVPADVIGISLFRSQFSLFSIYPIVIPIGFFTALLFYFYIVSLFIPPSTLYTALFV